MSTQRELEMRRGAEVVARHAADELYRHGIDAATHIVMERREVLQRWLESRKVHFITTPEGNRIAYVADEPIIGERLGPAFPSESYVAQVGLAIGALDTFRGVPEHSEKKKMEIRNHERQAADSKHRDAARKRQSQWRQIHEPDTL